MGDYKVFYYDRPYQWVCIRLPYYKDSPNPLRLICLWEGRAKSERHAITLAKCSAKARNMY